jgi:putative ABC transport system permease protein
LRWAWRLFRKEWRQQSLILALLTLAVTGAVTGASITVNAASGTNGEFGDAGAMIRLDVTDSAAGQAAIAAVTQRYGTVEVIGHRNVAVPGSVESLDVRTQDPNGVFGHSMLAVRKGRYPLGADEVALSDGAMDLLSTAIGRQVSISDVRRTVVGLVENPRDLNDEFALLQPTDALAGESLTLLLASANHVASSSDRQNSTSTPQSDATGFDVMIAGSGRGAVSGAVLVATTIAMALVCLIATAGFLVVAQHRQRQLGMMAALGATERHLRLVMLADGMIVGVTAALAGAVLGALCWMAVAPAVEAAAEHRIGRLDLPWGLIAGCMGIAVLAATAAAWWPARTVARMPVMAALSTRPGRPSSVRHSLLLAIALTAVGMSAIALSNPTGLHVRSLALIGGLLALVLGVVSAAPAAIRSLAAPASWLPLAPRLALRDLVRYQARAAAALAAITLGLGLSVAVIGVAKANVYGTDEGNLSNRQILIRPGATIEVPGRSVTTSDPGPLDATAKRIATTLGHPRLLVLNMAMPSATANGPVSVARVLNNHRYGNAGPAFIATPELLSHYGIDPSEIGADTELLTSIVGDLVLLDPTARPDSTHVQPAVFPHYRSAPSALVTQYAMSQHGWVPARAGWLIETPKPLTTTQIKAARTAASQAGLTIETRSSQDGLATLRTIAMLIGTLLALAIMAMTIGLIRGEATSDLRTLTATGADPRTRRAITASTAGALAVLGVSQATVGAYAGLLAAYHADLAKLNPPPVANLLTLFIGLPVAATAAGWLLAGREPRAFARQTLD